VANALQDPERRKRALNNVLALKPNHVMAKALLNELAPSPTKTAKQSSSIHHQSIRRKTTPKPKRGFLERFLNRIVHSMVGLLMTPSLIKH
jgi:hypothetical protein